MDKEEIAAYMEEAAGRGISPGLEATKALLSALGNPEQSLRFVHIAGTNGKGSVLAYLSTVLQTAGYKVGRFYSPALTDPWDKIQINGRRITDKEIGKGLSILKESGETGTVFETECALALWYFAKKKCDIVILECGMGGAMDATNVIPAPELCIFTPIAMDHMQYLGGSIKEIAAAKAGIIKCGCTVVTVKQEKDILKEIYSAAENAADDGTAVTVCEAEEATDITYGLFEQHFSCSGYRDLVIRLAGVWQIENAALAVTALGQLKKRGFEIPDEAIRKGLADTAWDGRLTVLKKKPVFLMDGAHNEAAVRVLRLSLEKYFPGERFVMILGVLKDKAYEKELRLLLPLAVHLITVTPPENARALPAYVLAETAQEILSGDPDGAEMLLAETENGLNHPADMIKTTVTAADSVEEAVEMALLLSAGKLPILATGSLSWIGRLRGILRKRGNTGR